MSETKKKTSKGHEKESRAHLRTAVGQQQMTSEDSSGQHVGAADGFRLKRNRGPQMASKESR
jgi:hypothetical protein